MVSNVLSWLNFAVLGLVLFVAPWIFGAWEMWWCWSFVVIMLLSAMLFGLRLVLAVVLDERFPDPDEDYCRSNLKLRWVCLLSFIPFLLYGLYRVYGADVYMDAEKSLLLHFTGLLVGVQVVFGLSRRQCRLLFVLITADLLLLGAYGLINHWVTGNKMVMWAQGYEQYWSANRTTGSYYCPDHFSGIMELAICICLGLLFSRRVDRLLKYGAAVLLIMALTGVMLSQSRGGGITVLAIFGVCLVYGFHQWPVMVRWYCRLAAVSIFLLGFVVFLITCDAYVSRFHSYFAWEQMKGKPLAEKREILVRQLDGTSRGKMYGAALRAWRTAPWCGIGPGMHQNLWQHFAPTADGSIELGVTPRMLNNDFYSYEVHSDWLQLLEEYGLIGLLLFLVPVMTVLYILLHEINCERRDFERHEWSGSVVRSNHAAVLAGILAWVSMVVHSFGDFNLQMPATVWLLAGIMAIPINLSQGLPEEKTDD